MSDAVHTGAWAEVVKLASNEFPLPPFDEVKAAVTAALDDRNRYPDGHATDLRAALAENYGRALGGPGWARVSVGTKEETDFFLAKLGSFEPTSLDENEGRSS